MRLTPRIHAMKIPFQVPLAPGVRLDRFVYMYLIEGQSLMLVDAGVKGAEQALVRYLLSLNKAPRDVVRLLLTHAHPDHIGAAPAIAGLCACRVMAPEAERRWFDSPQTQFNERPVPGFFDLVSGPVPVDTYFNDGDRLEGIGLDVHVLHTPGHSAGSTSFWIPSDGVMLTGDALILPGQFPIFDDFAATMASVFKIRAVRGMKLLLSAWQDPDLALDPYAGIEQSLQYLEEIREATLAVKSFTDPMDLCRQAVEALRLPPAAINPLVARSLMSIRNA